MKTITLSIILCFCCLLPVTVEAYSSSKESAKPTVDRPCTGCPGTGFYKGTKCTVCNGRGKLPRRAE